MSMSSSITKDLLKPRKCTSELGFDIAHLSKDYKHLEEKTLDTISSIKKLKHVHKDLKQKEGELEMWLKDVQKSEEELESSRKKLGQYQETLQDLCKACKNNDEELISKILNANKHKTLKLKIPRGSLSIEDVVIKPETSRSTVKTSRNTVLKSPYEPNLKILTFSTKKLKKTSKMTPRIKTCTPSIKTKTSDKQEKSETHGKNRLKVEGKLKRLIKRFKKILLFLNPA